jgi:signal transduction histidine kinase
MPENVQKSGETILAMSLEELQAALKKSFLRINQLKLEIDTRQEENEKIIENNLQQNEKLRVLNHELITFNLDLENKVQERTRELQTSKQHLEAQAIQLQELSVAKEALTHMIVHDMKNPLTVILGSLKLFKQNSFGLPELMHECMLDSQLQATKLLRMIEEILFIGRMQSKEFQLKLGPCDVTDLVQQCVSTMTKTIQNKQLTLVFNPPANLPALSADADMVERIVNNLLNNSIKYAPAKSEILVEITHEGSAAAVHITNWGDAIPEEYHEKIFELFSRVNAKDKQLSGTGLGLAFCKMAVDAHGGKIGVVSPVLPQTCGTRFSFTLPYSPALS